MATRARTASFAAMMLACAAASAGTTVDYPGLGTVTIEQPAGTPQHVVIFLSGDGGWNKGVVDMARHLVDQGGLVAGVDGKKPFAFAAMNRRRIPSRPSRSWMESFFCVTDRASPISR